VLLLVAFIDISWENCPGGMSWYTKFNQEAKKFSSEYLDSHQLCLIHSGH